MISKELVETLIDVSGRLTKDFLLKSFICDFITNNSYNDNKVNRLLELLIGKADYIIKDDINLEYIKENMSEFVYKGESYSFQNVLVNNVNNIDSSVTIDYQYKDKDSDSEDNWLNSYTNIDIFEYPKVLKKS